MDDAFAVSVGGMMWPRGYVTAASFYNWNATAQPTDPAFVAAIWAMNDMLAGQGYHVCPTNCTCNQLTQCGKPIVPTPPPAAGQSLVATGCILPVAVNQRFALNAKGQLAAVSNASVCLLDTGAGEPRVYLRAAA